MMILHWLQLRERTAASLAVEVGCSKAHLSHIMAGRLRPSPQLALRIEQATGGAVSRAVLRPDIFDTPAIVMEEPA